MVTTARAYASVCGGFRRESFPRTHGSARVFKALIGGDLRSRKYDVCNQYIDTYTGLRVYLEEVCVK